MASGKAAQPHNAGAQPQIHWTSFVRRHHSFLGTAIDQRIGRWRLAWLHCFGYPRPQSDGRRPGHRGRAGDRCAADPWQTSGRQMSRGQPAGCVACGANTAGKSTLNAMAQRAHKISPIKKNVLQLSSQMTSFKRPVATTRAADGMIKLPSSEPASPCKYRQKKR